MGVREDSNERLNYSRWHHSGMNRALCACLALTALAGCQALPPAPTAALRLDAALERYQVRYYEIFPQFETSSLGPGPHQGRWESLFTDEHRERQRILNRDIFAVLKAIDPADLDPGRRLSRAILQDQASRSLDLLRHPTHYVAVVRPNFGGAAFDILQVAGTQPMRDARDFDAWLRKAGHFPAHLDAALVVLRTGLAAGHTAPRPVAERSLAQLESLATADPAQHPLWRPVAAGPSKMSGPEWAAFEAKYRVLLADRIAPAAARFAAYLRTEYLPKARTTQGLQDVPGGGEIYRSYIRFSTTRDLAPADVHALGLSEVRRIQEKLKPAAIRMGYDGPIEGLGRWIAGQPALHPFQSPEDVLAYLKSKHALVVPQLPKLFGRIPKASFDIRLVPPELVNSSSASYSAAAVDGSRPGIFHMPVRNAREHSITGLATLLAHEGMPGHHFDVSIAQESNLPPFRRTLFISAFGEGWGLYAESLGLQIGLYDDPPSLVGHYLADLFRACRLVVDTGIHALGWSRERAVQYFLRECGSSRRPGVESEVDRYAAWPGQALSYKVGEITIRKLREKAEATLGAKFDQRAFHDHLLAEGRMPLDLLQARMDAWIAARK